MNQAYAESFTGSVRIGPLFSAAEPSRVAGGTGWVQQWGRPVQEIREGDVVPIRPGQKHWNGATASTRMTHIAFHEQMTGRWSSGWRK